MATRNVTLGFGLIVAAGLVVSVARHPAGSILVLVALLPFATLISTFEFRVGLSQLLVRDVGYWPELVLAGCVLAAVHAHKVRRQRIDIVDVLALVYIGVAALYRLSPHLFVHPNGAGAIGPPTGATIINTALRND
ncbi:MAG: hypothetical protein M3137_06990, partial [Actinomycetota bacterium]|nr:hypothetical protein [Actinomycetota bacterium]